MSPPRGVSSPDRFVNPNATLRGLIRYAYELTDSQIVGGPEWIASRATRRTDIRLTCRR